MKEDWMEREREDRVESEGMKSGKGRKEKREER